MFEYFTFNFAHEVNNIQVGVFKIFDNWNFNII